MDGPPTSRMYSPDTGDDACEPSARIDRVQTSKRRFIMASEGTIYAERQITQVLGRLPSVPRSRIAFADGLPHCAIPTSRDRSLLPPDPATFAVFESAQAGCHEPALPR